MKYIDIIDGVAYAPIYAPRRGWHDDHRHHDRTPEYLPALQQVRSEFDGLLDVLQPGPRNRCLQLGLGECAASHDAWRRLFNHVLTVDLKMLLRDDLMSFEGGDTHSEDIRETAKEFGELDFLFIDAGHTFLDVCLDHAFYGPMVRSGGIIAFHDALPRPDFPEVEVWRYLENLPHEVHMIGTEVGIAWIVKR